ncbi:protein PATRONUS 2-like [Senna tora]|uniref:Protein PATRONUS 2-like n=1 Tax=Senna tora TaxID=362788 RepID=A0A834T0F4_9FABA|nr:protein PATRONUS 2-like [Senna tora]
MATRTGRLLPDQNLGVHMDGTTIPGKENLKGQRKLGAGGRKPLGDLSNSGKLSINQPGGRKALDGSLNSGKQLKKPNKLASVEEEAVPCKAKNLESNNRTATKASEKLQTSNRKALSDISNSGKLHNTVGEIKNKSSQKQIAFVGEPLHLSAIAEELCLHKIIKSVSNHNSDDHLAFSSEGQSFNQLKPESDLKHLELEEIPELPEVESSWKGQVLATQPASPAHCMNPKISSCYKLWEDCDVIFNYWFLLKDDCNIPEVFSKNDELVCSVVIYIKGLITAIEDDANKLYLESDHDEGLIIAIEDYANKLYLESVKSSDALRWKMQ